MPASPTRIEDTMKQWLDSLGQYSVVLGGAAYGIGLLIQNLYLSAHGAYANALLNTDYILIGLLWCFLVFVGLLLGEAAIHFLALARRAVRERRVVVAVLCVVVSPPLLFYSPEVFLDRLSADGMRAGDLRYFMALLAIGSAAACIVSIRLTLQEVTSLGLTFNWNARGFAFQVAISFLFLLGSLTFYAREVYPHLHPAFGGGGRHAAFLVLASDTPPAVVNALPRSRRNGSMAGPVTVLLETDLRVVVLPRPWHAKDRAVSLPRDAVKAIVPVEP